MFFECFTQVEEAVFFGHMPLAMGGLFDLDPFSICPPHFFLPSFFRFALIYPKVNAIFGGVE